MTNSLYYDLAMKLQMQGSDTPPQEHTKQANEALRAAAQRTYAIAKEAITAKATPLPESLYSFTGDIKDINKYRIAELCAYGAAETKRLTEALQAVTAERDALKADAERLNWLDKQGYAYGFEDMHEGNQWDISGPFSSIRVAIDVMKGTS